MKILLIALSLLFISGCSSTFQERAANRYSLDKVSQAAGVALKKVSNAHEFALFNIPPGENATPGAVVKFIRECQVDRLVGAIASDRLDGIYDLINSDFSENKNERFDGLVLIIVSANKDPERFDALLLSRGIIPVYATY